MSGDSRVRGSDLSNQFVIDATEMKSASIAGKMTARRYAEVVSIGTKSTPTEPRAPFRALFALAIGLAVGCGGDPEQIAHESSDIPDAASGQLDASTSQPDATTAQPDATAGQPDAAPATPMLFAVTFAAGCPALSACGGALDGTWFYTGLCIEHAEYEYSDTFCSAQFVSASGTAQGSVVFSGGQITRDLNITTTVVQRMSGMCLSFYSCDESFAAAIIEELPGATATCAMGSSCECTITSSTAIADTGSYAINGSDLSTGSPQHTYGYCVSGNTLEYRDTTASDAEPGIATLEKH